MSSQTSTNSVTAITPRQKYNDQYFGCVKFPLIDLEAEKPTRGKHGLWQ